jgi:hypothetical protein
MLHPIREISETDSTFFYADLLKGIHEGEPRKTQNRKEKQNARSQGW